MNKSCSRYLKENHLCGSLFFAFTTGCSAWETGSSNTSQCIDCIGAYQEASIAIEAQHNEILKKYKLHHKKKETH
jgi:hypothetical protein